MTGQGNHSARFGDPVRTGSTGSPLKGRGNREPVVLTGSGNHSGTSREPVKGIWPRQRAEGEEAWECALVVYPDLIRSFAKVATPCGREGQ